MTTNAQSLAGVAGPGTAGGPRAGLLPSSRRPSRVVLLTLAIIMMSLADLQITLTYLRSGGMGEGNPVARYVMEHGSSTLLVVWKCCSVGLAAVIFVNWRSRRSAELGCWFCAAVLVWILIRWIGYADEAWRLTPVLHTLSEVESAEWVHIRD